LKSARVAVALGYCALMALLSGCAASPKGETGSQSAGGSADSGPDAGSGGTGGTPAIDSGDGGDPFCACAPGAHNDRIFVLSDEGEIWTYDPLGNAFARISSPPCTKNKTPFSMAVDPVGRAWVLLADDRDIQRITLDDPPVCEDPGYTPDSGGFGLFGMTFASASGTNQCVTLYLHSYSGSGPFGEGPGVGALGAADPNLLVPSEIAKLDFNGGELAGTGDGRLFAFAGANPAKLIEYDKSDGAVVELTRLSDFWKTNASAFAFFAGDIYFFTEARGEGCDACLGQSCPSEQAACASSAACTSELGCALAQGDITDACGGAMPEPLTSCLFGPCASACFPDTSQKVSQVARLDYDQSDAPGRLLTIVNPRGPIRIVGAGASTCVPAVPR
jgi:hypothetical protein